MAEKINDRTVFSLFEVTKSIQKTITERYKKSYWIKAEMNTLNYYRSSGHCFPELVEKRDGNVVAQIRSILWRDDYEKINNNFQRVLKEPLKDGIKILFLAHISFDSIHGLAIKIIDIDPSYTLGDLEREKQETIKKLQDEGLFQKNKTLKIPLLPQRIAIISVDTSKGYVDFLKVIESNTWNYKFFYLLFPSLLQGEKAIDAIINQLKQIKKVISHFDAVAIIRGGGDDIGLSCYNSYRLTKEIAAFPIPIITGIGHATNETVTEMISFSNAITPTKLAEYLLQKFHNFSIPVRKAEEKIVDKSRKVIDDETVRFNSEIKIFRSVTESIIIRKKSEIKEHVVSLSQQSRFRFKKENENLAVVKQNIQKGAVTFCNSTKQQINIFGYSMTKDVNAQLNRFRLLISQSTLQVIKGSKVLLVSNQQKANQLEENLSNKCLLFLKTAKSELTNIDRNVNNMDPKNVMSRGYSITLVNGKSVTNVDQVKRDDILETLLFEGSILSTAKELNKSEKL